MNRKVLRFNDHSRMPFKASVAPCTAFEWISGIFPHPYVKTPYRALQAPYTPCVILCVLLCVVVC